MYYHALYISLQVLLFVFLENQIRTTIAAATGDADLGL